MDLTTTLPSRTDTPLRTTQSQPFPSDNPELNKSEGIPPSMKDLIVAINEVEVLLGGVKDALPLPRIVAVGDQSSGKSSLIEAIRYFLSKSALWHYKIG
jgi:hypothetical protein